METVMAEFKEFYQRKIQIRRRIEERRQETLQIRVHAIEMVQGWKTRAIVAI